MSNLNFRKTRLAVKPENLGSLCSFPEFPFQVGKTIESNMLYVFGTWEKLRWIAFFKNTERVCELDDNELQFVGIFFFLFFTLRDCLKQERYCITLLGLP